MKTLIQTPAVCFGRGRVCADQQATFSSISGKSIFERFSSRFLSLPVVLCTFLIRKLKSPKQIQFSKKKRVSFGHCFLETIVFFSLFVLPVCNTFSTMFRNDSFLKASCCETYNLFHVFYIKKFREIQHRNKYFYNNRI